MLIRFRPKINMKEATHVLSGLVWAYDEVKDIDPDWTIRVRVDGMPINVRVVDDLLSSGEYHAVAPSPAQDENSSDQTDN